ncbi:VOC family protein [Streptomyces calvus]|jgi:predicted enzyme related to lactoylglutathione lyase|uniref:VOC family protein n=1 Tax=Streptomyces calvus TaxID=67282 RepID=UPI00371297B8
MTDGLKTIVYPVKDLGPAKELFRTLLGVEPYADEPYYVGFRAGGHEIGLDPHGHAKGMTGPVPYWNVGDVRGTLAELVAAGATPVQDAQDVGGGTLIASVRDQDGNVVGLVQDAPA